MGKNVTIYLPDEVAQKMDKLPEVNWSEICRKAITDYIESRTQTDLTSVINRLKNESKSDYTKGQLVIYEQVAPKISLAHLEDYGDRVDLISLVANSFDPTSPETKLSPQEANEIALGNMMTALRHFEHDYQAKVPGSPSQSYVEGALSALRDLYKRVKKSS